MPSPTISHCDTARCGAAIFFVVVSNQAGRKPKLMPVNAAPDPGGNVAVLQDETGTWRGRVLGKDQEPAAWEARYCPHFATCTDPGAYRRRQQRGEWSRARSAHAAGQRNRRAGRAAVQPGPGMFRIDPPGQCTACLTITDDLAGGLCSNRDACEARQPPLFGLPIRQRQDGTLSD